MSQGFEFTYGGNLSGELQYDSEHLQKGNYTVFIKAEIRLKGNLKELYSGQEKIVKTIELPVKVTDQKPSVKVKLPNLNVFYQNAGEQIQFTTSETIAHVELVDYKNNGVTSKFSVEKDRAGGWILQPDKKVTKKGSYPVEFKIWLIGYTEPVSVKGQIKTVVTAPKLQVISEGLSVYKSDRETANVSLKILNTIENQMIDSRNGYQIAGANIVNEDVTITGLESYGKKTVVLSVTNSDMWNDKVDVKVPVVVEDAKKIALESDCSKISINKKIGDMPEVRFFMKQTNLEFYKRDDGETSMEIKILDSKKLPYGGIEYKILEQEDKEVTLGFYATEQCKTGKYQAVVSIQPAIGKNAEWCTKTITINVVEKEPSVKIGLKGKIDLYNRNDTYMSGTVTLTNIAGRITKVKSERNDFQVYMNGENQFELYVRNNAAISRKKQTVILDIYVDHDGNYLTEDIVLKKAVNVSLTESKLVWKKQEKPLVV